MVSSITKRFEIAVLELKGLAEFLQDIPETSMLLCPRSMGLDEWEGLNKNTANERKMLDLQIVKQSRFEVLCRTLLVDSFLGQHPASWDDCCDAVLDVLHDELYRRQITAVLILFCEMDNTTMRSTENLEETLDRSLNYERAREEVGQYFTEMQKILGSQAVVDGDIIFPPEFERFEARRASSVEKCFETKRFLHELNGRQLSGPGRQALMRLDEMLKCRDLFITNQGHLGVGLTSLEVGDEVWVLVGVRVPLILRPVGEGQYRLVGEAYVHGIMHGEAIDKTAEESIRELTLI
jgi:hypothetical protein